MTSSSPDPMLLASPVTLTQAQALVFELNKILAQGQASKESGNTAELKIVIAQVINELQTLAREGVITATQAAKVQCSIGTLANKLGEGTNGAMSPESTKKTIFMLILVGVLITGFSATGDKKSLDKVMEILYNILYMLMYALGIVVSAGLLYWSVSTLVKNDWDVGKSLADMTSTIIEEIVIAIGDTLVQLASDLWSAVTGELSDIAETDSGDPEWYDFISPILAATYISDVIKGNVPSPFSSNGSSAQCPTVPEMINYLNAVIEAKSLAQYGPGGFAPVVVVNPDSTIAIDRYPDVVKNPDTTGRITQLPGRQTIQPDGSLPTRTPTSSRYTIE